MAGPQSGFDNLLGSASPSSGPVPLHHMDYAYIGLCRNVKELEKILKALRSGADGYYPDLIKCCEQRIATLDPKSKALRKDKPPASKGDLGKEEWQQINSDIKDWTTEMGKESASSSVRSNDDKTLPPIRQPATVDTSGKKKKDEDKVWAKPSKERIKSSDYRSWDKFDAEKAAEEADLKKHGKKDSKQLKKSSAALSSIINTDGMTDKERELVANKEKDKGNEAFKAGDYEEAVQYYSRSISVIPSAPAYNNRSLARIKLCQFIAAVEDCTKVLELEPENIKALLRRGTALKSLRQFTAAKTDLEAVLNAESNNKQALDLLADIMLKETVEQNSPKPYKERDVEMEPTHVGQAAPPGRRMIIQEVEDESDSEEEDAGKGQGSLVNGRGAPNSDEGAVNGATKASAMATENQDGGQGAVSAETSLPSSNGIPVQDGPVAAATPPVSNPIPALPLPDDVIALKDSGNELFKAGQYGNAMEKYSLAIKKILPDKESFTAALASLYNNRSACNSKTGHLKETIEDCDAALEIQPYSAKALVRRGAAYDALEKYRHAYVDYQTAMKVDAANQLAQSGAARVMKILSEQDGPKWREKLPSTPSPLGLPLPPPSLTTMAPSNAPVPSVTSTTSVTNQPSMATSQVKGQDVQGQKVEPKPSAQDQPDTAPVPNANASKGSSEKAKAESEVKGQADPVAMTDPKLSVEDNFLKLKTKGNTLVQQGNYEKAAEFYTACIALDPKQLVSYTNRALCFIKLLKGNEAEADCTQALELDDGSIKALYRRALARKMLHKYSDGIRDLMTLLKIEPHNASAKKELDLVKELWRQELKDNQQKTTEKPKQTTQPPPAQQKSEDKVKPEVNSAEVKPAEVKPAKGKISEVKPAEVKSSEAKPADVKPAEMKPAKGKSAEVKTSEVKSSEVKPAEVKPAQKKKKKGKRMQIQEVEGNSEDENDVKKASPKPTEKPPAKDKKGSKTPKDTGSQKGGKTPGGEDDKVTVPKLTKVTAYEFLQAWTSLKRQRSMLAYAELLKQISPEELPEVLTNKLDGDMVVNIVKAVCEHLVESDGDLSYGLLANLPKVERFKAVVMFLSTSDKKRLRNSLKKLGSRKSEAYVESDIEKLRQHYSLK
ncbi:sperm-associated antigen 1-like [Patiria miniata]|uniref:RNA-polymerase II-associated protein 3-like C-terminal domain-containing protein n=1 Tax=Patiria miniata TaxID=46514 RepID=A0A913ZLX2_PATMI|nr:sperm-associated antigen 1-like [Patiria miniata]XP_038052101.1 sperm-associated antigen 1-like [Patiria miniata]